MEGNINPSDAKKSTWESEKRTLHWMKKILVTWRLISVEIEPFTRTHCRVFRNPQKAPVVETKLSLRGLPFFV